MERLPCCDGFPNEFVVAREHRNGYDHAVRAAGARLVEVGFNEITAHAGVRRTEAWEYEAAFGPGTAGVHYGFSPTSQPALEQVVESAHRRGLPVLVDAAGELPPRENLTRIIAAGADLVAFSGGKAIRGPQSTGILCGSRDLIASAALQMLDMDDHPQLWDPPRTLIDRSKLAGMPRHGIGRSLKVSKEEIAALLKALELFAAGAFDFEVETSRRGLEKIAAGLKLTQAQCRLIDPGDGQSPAVLEIAVNEPQLGRTAFEVCRRLRDGVAAGLRGARQAVGRRAGDPPRVPSRRTHRAAHPPTARGIALEHADVVVVEFLEVLAEAAGDPLVDVEEVRQKGRADPHAVADLVEIHRPRIGIDVGRESRRCGCRGGRDAGSGRNPSSVRRARATGSIWTSRCCGRPPCPRSCRARAGCASCRGSRPPRSPACRRSTSSNDSSS